METITILSALTLLFILLFYGKRLQTKNSHENSGVALTYKVFIDNILANERSGFVDSAKVNSINIKTSAARNASVFSLNEVQGRVIIVWTWSDLSFGRRGKEWSFPNYYDQEKMYEEIMEDVSSYQISLYQKHNRMSVPSA